LVRDWLELEGHWPDEGLDPYCSPAGGPNTGGNPFVDPPPVHSVFAPNGAYLDIDGSGVISSSDLLHLSRQFDAFVPYKARSDWSVVAELKSVKPGWYVYWTDRQQKKLM